MNDRDRLEQLRVLLGRLERMPASPERDWMQREVRARAVDVETGVKPAAMRARSGSEAEAPAAPEAPRIEAAEPVPPRKPRRRPASRRRTPAHAGWGVLRAGPAIPAAQASLGAVRRRAAHDSVVDLLEQGGVLCLDDQPAAADAASRPWSGGLRG